MDLKEKHCVPCEGATPPLGEEGIKKYSAEVPDWGVVDGKKISKEFKFPAKSAAPVSGQESASRGKDSPFKEAMAFINRVAEIAEAEKHHPDIHVFYNKVRLELSTHSIGGLSENDFILAAKINALADK